jgi:hypothetical protein
MLALVRCAAVALALAAEATPAPTPAAMTVPEALLGRTSMPEPSGIVWSPPLNRYLLVSDDTGDKAQGTNHAPWLFTMSREGVLDDAPLPILGLEKLNDAEALCAGPAGTYFLATSHSANRKGKDKPERRRLFHLALSGRALSILGSVDLAGAIVDSGLLPSPSIDIEALAFSSSAGQLYVGLKAPQSAQGAAYILRVRDIATAMKAGALPADHVQRFAEVPLHVPAATGQVVQGISDMSFLPDGSLAILANSPKGLPSDGGGALYVLRAGSAPRLVRRFLGLKPEGVTMTDDGKSMLLVFDNDRRSPLFLRQPLPQK